MNLEELGRQFGLDEAQTRAAFEQLAPVVAAGVRRNTQSSEGLEGLIRALQTGNHGRYVEDPSALEYDRVADDGNAITRAYLRIEGCEPRCCQSGGRSFRCRFIDPEEDAAVIARW